MSWQLPLQLKLPDHGTFANYFAGPNRAAVASLRACAKLEGDACLYLWGKKGLGKSHLLQSVCRQATQEGHRSGYLPLGRYQTLSPLVFEGLEVLDIVCLDDVHAVAGQAEWERALFHFYNRMREHRSRLVIGAEVSPSGLALRLADLRSRMAWCPVFQLVDLSDGEKLGALQLRARTRGLELPPEVGNYLLRRCPRDMLGLFQILDRLDEATLAEQRRLTIPFVRRLLV